MILGVDPGSKRVGLAVADRETRFARPLGVVDRDVADPVARVVSVVDELGVDLVVVGRPVGLSGRAGPAVDAQQELVGALREALSVAVVEHDERLTTIVADQGLRAGGARKRSRDELRDAVAAQVMLQGYLDANP